jgi:tRNA-dihydrouridine synthase
MAPIRELKRSISIPVIANGDIKSARDAQEVLEYTGADGIMIGRAAVGNPFVFRQIIENGEGKVCTPASEEEKVVAAKRQLKLAMEDKGEEVAVLEARKQIALYFKGHPGTALLRSKINSLKTYSEVCEAIDSCYYEKNR